MELIAIVLGLVFLAVPAVVIYLLISNADLNKRLKSLEDHIRYAQPRSAQQSQNAPISAPITSQPTGPISNPLPEQPLANPTASPSDPNPPKSLIVNSQTVARLIAWLTKNWFYAVSAVSLALAGIFLVQYGIEKGLLPPTVRVLAAVLLGAAFIASGEYIRRRFGDDEDSNTAYLPSTFSSAGIVTLFGAVLSARSLYGLIGPEAALVCMALVGTGAMVLGWFYGPLLAAIGIAGAMAAPFIVGGSSPNPSWLFAYFAIIVTAGLAIDTIRRWAWVSVLSLALGFSAGILIVFDSSSVVHIPFMAYCATLALAAITVPMQQVLPTHSGSPLVLRDWSAAPLAPWPDFPTRLAAAGVIAACSCIVFIAFLSSGQDVYWAGFVIAALLAMGVPLWAHKAPALDDLSAAPAIAMGLIIASGGSVWTDQVATWRQPDGAFPIGASVVVVAGLAVTAAAAWRSLYGRSSHIFFAALAALSAPCFAILAEVFWQPANAFATYGWALHAMIIAVVMVVLAERFHAADGPEDRLRTALAALSAMASVAFGLVILFSDAALTFALALTVLAAAVLDRKFRLAPMSAYIVVGIATVLYRLIVEPGLEWADDAPLPTLLLSHAGALAAFAGAWYSLRGLDREKTRVMLDSAAFASAGVLLSLLLYRAILHWSALSAIESHWSLGVTASIWITLTLAQLRKLSIGGPLRRVRLGFSLVFSLIAMATLLGAVLIANPLWGHSTPPILGPIIVTSLIPAYLLPAALTGLGALWLTHLRPVLRAGLGGIAAALATLWLGLTIRHFWRGPEAMQLPGMEQSELYTYTVVLLLAGAIIFYKSLARRTPFLRKAGLVVIGLAVAKVFLIDISGLGGLTRVFSLLFLGLSLAGLAWLNRWAEGQATGSTIDMGDDTQT